MPDWADLAFDEHCESYHAVEKDLDAAADLWRRLKLEAWKRLLAWPGDNGPTPVTQPGDTPTNLISTAVAVKDYNVSRQTIARHVHDKKLKDHRPKDSPSNSPFLLERTAVAARWPRR
jgi:hypothetical protein